ncbi:chromate resistance protein [Streptomyces sp. Li-HN-5-11]|uniref:chromate resistance protein ChrB domain-containing protein n=1 Tax=Streptomyces sp. Li-HN-5-11 TaxID=3075432 RepID=UPI0028B1512B|nr:chromate resistance protein ChrB domain-containing protein [Streptomyces sp. Li-HN-5-11]WNM31660.1 chromate resistance protein [Streptomyces sp. Li-HN-5-11]
MLWVTTAHVHLDRVASPWLIARFVDDDATFGFIGADDAVPPDATPFAIEGAELGRHDAEGSTFRKILTKFSIEAPELQAMARCVEVGIDVALGRPVSDVHPEVMWRGQAMASFSEAMAVLHPDDDAANLAASATYYDAVYVSLWSAFGESRISGDLRQRIRAVRMARDWPALLPAWPRDPDRRPRDRGGVRPSGVPAPARVRADTAGADT